VTKQSRLWDCTVGEKLLRAPRGLRHSRPVSGGAQLQRDRGPPREPWRAAVRTFRRASRNLLFVDILDDRWHTNILLRLRNFQPIGLMRGASGDQGRKVPHRAQCGLLPPDAKR
jgi:hypothetical protein